MKVFSFLLALSLLTVGYVSVAVGQDEVTHNKAFKQKQKFGRSLVVEKDKSKPVRHALEERYAGIREAYFTDNPDGAIAFRSPEMTVSMPNGQPLSRDESDAYIRKAFTVVQQTITLSLEIDSLDVHGDTAVALIHQHWVRHQQMAGKLRTVDTQARQQETWINTPDGWLLFRINEIRPGPWIVDGKRVDPSKPYDPSAPPYEPEH